MFYLRFFAVSLTNITCWNEWVILINIYKIIFSYNYLKSVFNLIIADLSTQHIIHIRIRKKAFTKLKGRKEQ